MTTADLKTLAAAVQGEGDTFNRDDFWTRIRARAAESAGDWATEILDEWLAEPNTEASATAIYQQGWWDAAKFIREYKDAS